MGDSQSNNLDPQSALVDANTLFTTIGQEMFAPDKTIDGNFAIYTHEASVPNGVWTRNFGANHPIMALWDGAREKKTAFRVYTETARPVSYQATLQLPRRTFLNDKTGVVQGHITRFYDMVGPAFDQAVTTAFDSASGAGPTGYDGVALFSTAHPHVNSGDTASNLAAGTNLSHANAFAARAVGRKLKGENGEPLGIVYNMLRVGPDLEQKAKEIFDANERYIATNTNGTEATAGVVDTTTYPNVWAGAVQIFVDPRVTTYYWTMMDLTKGSELRPMRLLVERRPEPLMRTEMTDPARWEGDLYEWGIEGEYKAIAGDWITCYRGTGTE